jgi:hypothetical protein
MSLITQLKSWLPHIFGNNGNNGNNGTNGIKAPSPKLIQEQPRNNSKRNSNKKKSVKTNQKYQHAKALSKLVNNIDKRTPPEEKVLGIIDVLKHNPDKEAEIMAKYGPLLKKYKHVYTTKSAYGKKSKKRPSKKNN